MSRQIKRRLLNLVAIGAVVGAGVVFFNGSRDPGALTTGVPPSDLVATLDRASALSTCGSGFTTLVQLEPFLAGGVNPNASDTAQGAAERFMEDYLRRGRMDGEPIGVDEVEHLDGLTFYVPSPQDPNRAQIMFEVENLGLQFAVGVLWACDGALPGPDQAADDYGY